MAHGKDDQPSEERAQAEGEQQEHATDTPQEGARLTLGRGPRLISGPPTRAATMKESHNHPLLFHEGHEEARREFLVFLRELRG